MFFDGINTTQIFKNYHSALNDNSLNLKDCSSILNILEDDAKFNKFTSILFEGMSEDQLSVANMVCNAQRDFLIEEMSNNISNSDLAIGYAVSYFPILCDTYCTDILGNAILFKQVDKPILTIPKLKMTASVENSNGTVNNWIFPRAMFLIRSEPEEFQLLPTLTHDLFNLSKSSPNKINRENASINKKYFILKSLTVEIKKIDTQEIETIEHTLMIRPDARNQFNYDFEIISINNPKLIANCTVIGHIDFDRGRLQYDMTSISSDPNYKFSLKFGTFSCLFNSRNNDIGRVKISVKMSGMDIDISKNDDFEYVLDVETLHEYSDIYNIDLIRTLSTAIKGQILLNRDHDIANLLKSAIPDTKLNHTYEELQFVPIFDTNGYLSPGYYQSIGQLLIPKMSLIARYMYYNTTLMPTYIICGIKTSVILEALQEFIVTYPQMRAGLAGYNNKYGDKTINRSSFRSYKIIMSHAIPEDDLYMLYKPTTKDEEVYSNIVNFIYKPLYLVEEITNGQKRVFIKTRNSVELLNTSTIGYIYLPDINQYLSTSDYSPNPQHWF